MPTLHLSNSHFSIHTPLTRWLALGVFTLVMLFICFLPTLKQGLSASAALILFVSFALFAILKSKVDYTLTASHFQQSLFKGGWVVKWKNIEAIDICTYERYGWHSPLPWIGIRLKDYSPYLESVCPRIVSDILLSQRALLYLGARQNRSTVAFEDMVLDNDPYTASNGKTYHGLLAMLANRMRYQRQFFGYDLFISTADLDRNPDSFVGLTRRYLAAAID